MKLVTWNIQWGLGMDGRVDLPGIVAHARAMADFDVLCLQEVSDAMPDLLGSGGADQFAALAALLPGFRAIEGAGVDIVDAGGTRRRFGNMLLSRLPVRQVLRHTLPWFGGEGQTMPRLLVEAVVEAAFGPVRVLTTHLEYSSAELRAAQVEAMRAIHEAACDREARPRQPGQGPYAAQPGSRSAILCGDLNMKPHDPTLARIAAPFAAAPAFRDAWRERHPDEPHPPTFCIADARYGPPHASDYVFVTEDLAPRLDRIEVDVETRLSDHQPIAIELRDRPRDPILTRHGR